jgi:C4-dicarboxylate transporter DctM subunit
VTLTLLFGSFLILVLVGLPVAFALGLATMLVVLLNGDLPMLVVAQKALTGIDSYTLLSIPFFLLAGELMSAGGIADRLVKLSQTVIGHLRGGLGIASVAASLVFSGISGSSAADVSAIGSVVTRPMIREGYEPAFVASLQASAGMLGPLIPPSILMIIYATIADVSVAALFLSGIVPGLILGVALMAVTYVYAVRRNLRSDAFPGWRAIGRALVASLPALIAPLIIIVGIVTGAFTATEAGVIATLYALLVSLFVYRELRWRDLPPILIRSGAMTATLMFVVAVSSSFSYVLAFYDVPQQISDFIMAITVDKHVVLLLIIVMVLLLGTVVEVIPGALILVPVLHPLALQVGVDPIQFALIMVIALQAGGISPPVGVLLFISCSLAGVDQTKTLFYINTFMAVIFSLLVLFAFWPDPILWLPHFFLDN